MAVLVTGASGFLGSALVSLLKKGNKVYGLSRHPPAPCENLIPLSGDIIQPNLGIKETPKNIHAIYHLAAIHRLSEDTDGSIWETNVTGTRNVVEFCVRHDISRLFFCSTAYTEGRNTYEKSKALCEKMVKESDIPKVTIFKPSIILGTEEHPYPGHFSQFVFLVIKMHQRAEVIRRKIEGTLRLPVIEPVFRIQGNAEGKLNLVTVDAIARAMARIKREGTYWLTTPSPPTIAHVVAWISELIMVNIRILPQFKPTLLESQFQKMTIAFEPYLQGDDFPSHLRDCPPISKEVIHNIIKRTLLA